ncbi:MAG TPA: class I SAM-dependent methyltransferase [Egibacteraceae bacterium]|nr:class I SAM-dependent methyltransferase [Egibacteraceae bacterium]
MAEHDPGAYGRHAASDYDDLTALLVQDTAATVEALVELADGGPVVEFGIGTGRLALPLRARGVEVAGVEGSEDMRDLLRAKPGGSDIPVEIGDFAHARVPGAHALVALAFNTVYALPSQEAQVACFANAAAHLRPGGRFVLDAWLPDPGAFRGHQSVRTLAVRDDVVVVETALHDPVNQRMTTTKVRYRNGEVRLFPANHRYAWPGELDLMARLAGMHLEHRWGGWTREPFTADSTMHVSVYRRSEEETGARRDAPAG